MDDNRDGIIDDSRITSTDFDYDVYSGSSAQEYLRQENERKRKEREDAGKSAGMRKREEYEKRFAGMSPDELFGSPVKKNKPEEDDFSDFFDADEIERQKEKVSQFEKEVHSAPKVENMMPGEDEPSSQPQGMSREDALQAASIMIAHGTAQREWEDRRFHGTRRSRYYRTWFYQELFDSLLNAFDVSENGRSIIRRIVWDIAFFGIALGIYSAYSHARYRSISSTAVIWGAASCVVGGFLYQFFGEKNTLLRSLVNIIFEVIFLVIMVILVVFVKMK